ncbi:MAG: Gfo/Idh/MocA family protein [Brachybacterium tyrofermentans]
MLNVAVIGTGSIADAHLRAYLDAADHVRVVALADLTVEKAEEARERFGLTDARTYADVGELLASEDLDLVSVTTPPSAHRPVAVQALEAGVHVIVEKPMAPSLEDCDAMLEAQRRSGKLLSAIAQNRFRTEMMRLKAVLDSGKIGPVAHTRIASEWWRGTSYYDLWWRGTWASEGGGCTLNHAIHHIDLALWLLGTPHAVVAMMTNAAHANAEVEDLSVAILQYERGLAELTRSVVHHGQRQEIVVQGERARVSQPWEVVAETAQPNGFPTPDGNPPLTDELEAFAASVPPLEHTGHAAQLRDVMTAIEAGTEPMITGEDGRRAVELVTAIYASAIERRTIDLPLAPEDPYYRSGTLVERAPHFFEKSASVGALDGAITVGGSS